MYCINANSRHTIISNASNGNVDRQCGDEDRTYFRQPPAPSAPCASAFQYRQTVIGDMRRLTVDEGRGQISEDRSCEDDPEDDQYPDNDKRLLTRKMHTGEPRPESIELSDFRNGASSDTIVSRQPGSSRPHPTTLELDSNGFAPCDDSIDMHAVGFAEHEAENEMYSETNCKPSKAQVLHYFARAQKFTIKRVELDMQITDGDGFPLFDAYAEADCCGRTWTLEAYGRAVLVMREPMNSWCQDLARPRITVRDWNGDFFGILLPGDPFYLHSAERRTAAKMIPHRQTNGSVSNASQSNIGSQADKAELEKCASLEAEAKTLTSPKRAPVAASTLASATGKTTCWLCVHEGTGRHIARLEDYQNIQFNKDVAFQLKLLTLAGIVRLVGQSQLTPASNCLGAVKTILNCCAGY